MFYFQLTLYLKIDSEKCYIIFVASLYRGLSFQVDEYFGLGRGFSEVLLSFTLSLYSTHARAHHPFFGWSISLTGLLKCEQKQN